MFTIRRTFPDLTFNDATNLLQADDGNGRLFVTEQTERMLAFSNDEDAAKPDVFLDIRPLVITAHDEKRPSRTRLPDNLDAQDWEKGLLGLAFDPAFKTNGFLYLLIYRQPMSERPRPLYRP